MRSLHVAILFAASTGVFCKCPDYAPRGSGEQITVDDQRGAQMLGYACDQTDIIDMNYPGLNISYVEIDALIDKTGTTNFRPSLLSAIQEMFQTGSTDMEVTAFSKAILDVTSEDVYPLDFKEFHPLMQQMELDRIPLNLKGEPIGIPTKVTQTVILYDTEAFERIGIPIGSDPSLFPKSLDEFEVVMEKVQKAGREALGRDDYWGVVMNYKEEANSWIAGMLSWFSCGGGSIEKDGKINLDNPDYIAFTKRMQKWIGWIMRPNLKLGSTRDDLYDEMGAVVDGWWVDARKLDEANSKLGRIRWKVGAPPGPLCVGVGSGIFLSLSKNARHPELGMELLKAASHGVLPYTIDKRFPPFSNVLMDDPDLRAQVCANYTHKKGKITVYPMACQSFDEHREFFSRIQFRPGRPCGSFYVSCVGIIYKYHMEVLLGRITAEQMAVQAQSDLAVLLGYVDSKPKVEKESEWSKTERVALLAVAAGVGVVLIVFSGFVFSQVKTMRQGCGIPVAVMVGAVVCISLAVTIGIVVSMQISSSRKISDDFGGMVRTATIKGYADSIRLMLASYESTSLPGSLVFSTVSAKFGVKINTEKLMDNSLLVLVDRQRPRIRVSSDPAMQTTREIPDPTFAENDPDFHPWVSRGLLEIAEKWTGPIQRDPKVSLELTVNGEKLFLNFQTISAMKQGNWQAEWMLLYFVPEETIMGEANDALDKSLNISIMISLLSILAAVGCAILISNPLVRLAQDMEYIRLMAVEKVSTTRGSILKEVTSLYSGFDFMCSAMQEYKSFLPQSVLVMDDEDEESASEAVSEEVSMASGTKSRSASASVSRSISQSTAASVAQQKQIQTGRKLNHSNSGVVLKIVLPTKVLLTDNDTFGGLIEQLDANAKKTKGVLHTFTPDCPGEMVISWNVLGNAADAPSKAAVCSYHVGEDLKQRFMGVSGIGLVCSLGKITYGNMGSNTMRGFGFHGAVMEPVPILMSVSKQIGNSIGKVITTSTSGFRERVRSAVDTQMVEVIRLGKTLLGVWMLGAPKGEENEEWMYAMEKAEDPCTAALTKLKGTSDIAEAIATLLPVSSEKQTIPSVVHDRLTQQSEIRDQLKVDPAIPYYFTVLADDLPRKLA
eukprot:TRINITY_DN11952_c0_g2_i1.p1 TRINITY_DN11952_c0_g2~~TRINITY_DN11952_c0_g2_i1.p1  ORF type:complete len:1144 (+),score=177.25 TRINITY_DN11952_c0_g2_i1:84-3434(+)